MASFPVALFVVEGNGPGEPLEGQPLSALSIAVSGDDKTVAEGSFDGSEFNLTGAGFRIRIYLSSITMDDVGSVAAPIDFKVDGLNVTTSSPLSGGKLTLHIETTLGQNPTGNALADPILSGRQIVVDISGTLEQP